MITRSRLMRRLTVGAVACTVAATALAAKPASATMFEINTPWSFGDGGQFEDCGRPIDWQLDVSGTISIRTGKGKDASAFFAREQSEWFETWTDPATGDVLLTIETRQQIHDVQATRLEGSIFEFTTALTGQPFTVRDGNGNVLLRDRGRIAFAYVFDTGGDDMPGGTWLYDLGTHVSGPHPGFDIDLCELV